MCDEIIEDEQGCWIWQRARSSDGYGSVNRKGQPSGAHCFYYLDLVGPIPDGLELDHLCHVKPCVNPGHLEPVTHRENVRRHYAHAPKKPIGTHCTKGHEFTPENTYETATQRFCRICKRDLRKRRTEAERAAGWPAYQAKKEREAK